MKDMMLKGYCWMKSFTITGLHVFDERDERGATMVEYGLIVALIAIVAAAGVTTVGTTLNTLFGTTVNGKL